MIVIQVKMSTGETHKVQGPSYETLENEIKARYWIMSVVGVKLNTSHIVSYEKL